MIDPKIIMEGINMPRVDPIEGYYMEEFYKFFEDFPSKMVRYKFVDKFEDLPPEITVEYNNSTKRVTVYFQGYSQSLEVIEKNLEDLNRKSTKLYNIVLRYYCSMKRLELWKRNTSRG